MIEKRINYRFGGGYQGGAAGNTGQSRAGSGRDAGMGMAGKSKGPSRDVSVGVGKGGEGTLADPREKQDFVTQKYTGSFIDNILGDGYRPVTPTGQFQSRFSQMGGLGKGILGGLITLINPIAGLAYRGVDKLGALRDYDTLANYARGEFGLFQDEDEDEVDTIDIRDKFNRSGIMNPNLITPTNLNDYLGYRNREYIESTPSVNPEDYDFTGFEDAMAFNPGSIKDRALKQQFNIYNATGIVTPNMQKLMQEDIEQNQKKGTPLSLPAEAYNLITT